MEKYGRGRREGKTPNKYSRRGEFELLNEESSEEEIQGPSKVQKSVLNYTRAPVQNSLSSIRMGVPSPLLDIATSNDSIPFPIEQRAAHGSINQAITPLTVPGENQKVSGEQAKVGGKKKHWLWKCTWFHDGTNLFTCKFCNSEDSSWEYSPNKKFQAGNITKHMVRSHRQHLRAMKIDFKDVEEEISNVYTNEQFNYDITEWIAASGLPLSTVDNVFFRNIMTKARSDLKIMRRTQITQVYLPKLMDTVVNKV